MEETQQKTVWFITGSQHLYGHEVLQQVNTHAQEIASWLNDNTPEWVAIKHKSVLTNPEHIQQTIQQANAHEECIGLIAWMHTFSPAQMWINGLSILRKPLLHFHTQYNRDIPWQTIDMDFMNLNQSAHGDREFGHICTRLGVKRTIVVGHWKENQVLVEIEDWIRVAMGIQEARSLKVARFGDNMRHVAVTEGDKVEALSRFGWSVSGFGVGELATLAENVSTDQIRQLLDEYRHSYKISKQVLSDKEKAEHLAYAARLEIAIKTFLDQGGFTAFTTTFEDLHGLKQLPGLAVQRLMQQGYGFGAEGDWKTAALLRCAKVMATQMQGGTSFMEDYTYHLDPDNPLVLGAHMLEVCPSLAQHTPELQIHDLSIGGKEAPPRLVFSAKTGSALNASLIDMGNRFRLVVNTVEAITPQDTPHLPVAKAVWRPQPSLKTAAKAWILAGGAHHTVFSFDIKPIHLEMFADFFGIEHLLIDENTSITKLINEMRWNNMYYQTIE